MSAKKKPATRPAYGEDLAHVHDVGFDFFARGSAPALLAILKWAGIRDGLVVDLGCGSGIWARILADAGYRVLGVDISADMIKIARRRVPEAEFRVQPLLDATLPACRAVTAQGEVLNYLFDSRNSQSALAKVCTRVYKALEPGGVFIFDIAEPGRSGGEKERNFEGPDWACLVRYEHDDRRRRLTRRIVTFRKTGELFRRHEEEHVLQLYRAADVAKLLRKTGFRVQVLRSYGKQKFPKAYAGFVARKG